MVITGAVNLSAAPNRPWRHVFLTLAMLAVALKVLVPAGFMASTAKVGGLPLVICTGAGALQMAPAPSDGSDKHAPGEKPAHDMPCAFAGHGLATPAPDLAPIEVAAFPPALALAVPARPDSPTPGRGLAAPPPPSRGPPILS